MSAATSHSAHLYHLPLSFSFCWQIKIHGLPSHPFSLRCLIVSKIEEITGRNLCTNKNLSGSWQSIPWHTHTHTHTHTCLRYPTCGPRWETSNPILLSFQFHPPSLSCRTIKKSAGEGWETLEGRKIPHWETDEEHTLSLSVSWCWSASSFLYSEVRVTLPLCKHGYWASDVRILWFHLVKLSHCCWKRPPVELLDLQFYVLCLHLLHRGCRVWYLMAATH